MMWFLIALASAIIFGISPFLMKYHTYRKRPLAPFLFGLYVSGSAGFLIVAFIQQSWSISFSIVIAGILIGIGSLFGNVLYMKALEHGPASLTSPIVNTNILFIVFMSIIFYGEQLRGVEMAGVLLIFVAIGILPMDPKEKVTIPNRIWYVLSIGATLLFFLRNGGLKVTEEMALSNTSILFFAYLFGIAWSSYMLKKGKQEVTKEEKRISFKWGLFAGLFSFGGMQLYAEALLLGPASIISPLFATHSLLVAVLSILYLKEKLTPFQAVTLALVFIGIVLLRI